jgi:hypothetical protein
MRQDLAMRQDLTMRQDLHLARRRVGASQFRGAIRSMIGNREE